MKKLIALLLVLAMLIPAVGMADVDLSGLSFAELVALRNQIAQELTTRPEWKEVTVPIGVWKVGEDIPAGHWTVSPVDGGISMVSIGTALDRTEHDIDAWKSDLYFWKQVESVNYRYFNPLSSVSSFDFSFQNGYYVVVDHGPAVFSPYVGKPSLGFDLSDQGKVDATPQPEIAYIVNTSSRKFHYPECSGAANIEAKNRMEITCTREALIEQGYHPCGICQP